VFTTATFVGYQVAGLAGAVVATVAIFAPALVFVALLSRIVPLIRRSPWAGGALDGVNAASLGMMAAAVVRLADTALVDPLTVIVAVVALAVLLVRRPNSVWLVAVGATVGLARHLLG
jgi:chromate transporter